MAFNLRLPDDLMEQLRASAKENGWSINVEIIRRLRASFTTYRK